MHALYDRDEERSDHSTVDDIFGVFQVVTIGTLSFFAVLTTGLPHPTVTRMVVFWLAAIAWSRFSGRLPAVSGGGRQYLLRTSSSSGRARLLRASRARSSTTASTPCGWWALSSATTVRARARKIWS